MIAVLFISDALNGYHFQAMTRIHRPQALNNWNLVSIVTRRFQFGGMCYRIDCPSSALFRHGMDSFESDDTHTTATLQAHKFRSGKMCMVADVGVKGRVD